MDVCDDNKEKYTNETTKTNTYVWSLVKTDILYLQYTKMNCSRFWLSEFDFFWRERLLLSELNAEPFDFYIRRMESSLKSKEWNDLTTWEVLRFTKLNIEYTIMYY